MKRRVWLGGAAAGMAASLWPSWLRRAFAGPDDDALRRFLRTGTTPGGIFAAYKRARALGKPLLVLVIPSEERWVERQPRGHAFGAWLNYGGRGALADLALCEVVCAPMADVRRLAPHAGTGEPLMVLVETDAVPADVRRLDAPLDPGPPRFWVDSSDGDGSERRPPTREEHAKLEDAAIGANIAAIAKLVRTAVAPDVAALARRAVLARARIGAAEADRLAAAAAAGGKLKTAEVDRGAALVALEAARAAGPRRESLLDALAAAASARLVLRPPAGTHWAHSSGCGVEVEGVETSLVIGCGMGHVPERAQRFLLFFAVGA